MKAPGPGGRGCASRVCDRFAVAVDRSPRGRGRGAARRAGGASGGWGERCDPLARSRRGSGAGCWGGGPELGGASGGEDALAGDLAIVGERGEGLVELAGGGVAVQQVAELGAGQPAGERVGERRADLVGERVAGGPLQRPCGGALCVERERGVRVDGLDLNPRTRSPRWPNAGSTSSPTASRSPRGTSRRGSRIPKAKLSVWRSC